MGSEPQLERRLGVGSLTLYGVGVIVGAGIYVLVGQVAGMVGGAVALAFLLAALAAMPTGLSYAELASRHPRSAGEAVYTERAFGRPLFAFVIGYLVLCSGVASTAAVSHGFASYLAAVVPLPGFTRELAMVSFLALLSVVNHRGIAESTWLNALCTVLSVGALVVFIAAAAPHVSSASLAQSFSPEVGVSTLVAGTALSFYAFVGFEDICNVAEEVRAPHRTIPRAIVLVMIIVTALYAAVGIAVVSVAPLPELQASDAPLALASARVFPSLPPSWVSAIALLALTNTALVNLIMGSRILYGMASQGFLPAFLGRVHPRRRTPTAGVVTTFILAAAFTLTGFLEVLAEATSAILLVVFFVMNLAVIVIRHRRIPPDDPSQPIFRVSLVVPVFGLGVTGYLVSQFTAGAYLRALLLAATGAVLYVAHVVTSRKGREGDR